MTTQFTVHGLAVSPLRILMDAWEKVNKILIFFIRRHLMVLNLCQKSKKTAEKRISTILFLIKVYKF